MGFLRNIVSKHRVHRQQLNFDNESLGRVKVTLSREKRLVLVIRIICYAALLGFIFGNVAEFMNPLYDWDLDHELYFGQQLANGVPIWTVEFHDKLPFVQELFVLPAVYGDIKTWRLLSLLIVISGVITVRLVLPKLAYFAAIPKVLANSISWLTGVLSALWVTVLPGRIESINASANSFMLTSTLLLLLLPEVMQSCKRIKFFLILVSAAIMGAASISIRPYFVGPIICFAVLMAWGESRRINSKRLRSGISIFLKFLVALLISLVLLNTLPYIATGNINALVSGLRMNASDLNPASAINGMFGSVTSWVGVAFWFPFFVTIAASTYLMSKRSFLSPIIFTTLLGILSLTVLILRTHWWSHYVILFSGLACLLLGMTLVGFITPELIRDASDPGRRRSTAIYGLLLTTAFVTILGSAAGIYGNSNRFKWTGVNQYESDNFSAFEDYLQQTHSEEILFLMPSSMYFHWKSHEPRHGFPHAAHTNFIFAGLWKEIPDSEAFYLPKSPLEYCDLLEELGPAIVVDLKDSLVVTKCLTDSSRYRLDRTLWVNEGGGLAIYRSD